MPAPTPYVPGPDSPYGHPPGPQWVTPPPTQAPPPKRRTGLIVFLVLGALALLCGVGGLFIIADMVSGASDGYQAGTSGNPAPAAPAAPAVSGDSGTRPAASSAPAAPGFADGTLRVPDEVKPGTYRTTVPADSFGCYWERLRGFSGQFADIIGNGFAEAGQNTTLTVKASDKGVHARGCGRWVKVG